MRLSFILLLVVLSGCVANQSYREEFSAAKGREAIARCEAIGYTRNTPEIRECAMRLSEQQLKVNVKP